jgi:hypothetical protein
MPPNRHRTGYGATKDDAKIDYLSKTKATKTKKARTLINPIQKIK